MAASKIPNIAVVEDHALLRQTYRHVLQQMGYNVILEAGNGQQFLQMINLTAQPDLCLLDVDMPVMNGIETARYMRLDYPEIKIIVCSMNSDISVLRKFESLGITAFIGKYAPFNEFQSAIERALG